MQCAMRYLAFAIISGWMSKGGYLNECTACNGASNQHNSSSAYFILANFLNLSSPANKIIFTKKISFSYHYDTFLFQMLATNEALQLFREHGQKSNDLKSFRGFIPSNYILVDLKSFRLKNIQATHEKLKASWIVSRQQFLD